MSRRAKGDPAPMNAVVIVADSLRADHVGCYGNRWTRTPHLDALASESLVFENAYSEGLPTMPMRTAWWTGRLTLHERGWEPMRPDDLLLAEWLWGHGVRSALVTDCYHMHKPGYNCGRGFDTVDFIRGQEYDAWITDGRPVDLSRFHRLDSPEIRGDPRRQALWRGRFEQHLRNISAFPDWWQSDENHFAAQTVRAALRRLDEMPRGRPFLLRLDLFDPHEPWHLPDPMRSLYDPGYTGAELVDPVPGAVAGYMSPEEVRHTAALYAAEVTMVDKWIGIFLDGLRARSLMDSTLLVFTSDHGELLGERGVIRKARTWTYEDLAHVPLIVRHPQGRGAGRRCRALGAPQDLFPTLADALGVPKPGEGSPVNPLDRPAPQRPLHGHSLLPALEDPSRLLREFVITGWHGRTWALRDGRYHYVRRVQPEAGAPDRELYDLAEDPRESRNIAADRRSVSDALDALLAERMRSLSEEPAR